jgi:hypothetical protein
MLPKNSGFQHPEQKNIDDPLPNETTEQLRILQPLSALMWELQLTHNNYLFICNVEQKGIILRIYVFQQLRARVTSWHTYAALDVSPTYSQPRNQKLVCVPSSDTCNKM